MFPFFQNTALIHTDNTEELPFSLAGKRVFIAGETGMVGRALIRALHKRGHGLLLSAPHMSLNLTDQQATQEWMKAYKPEVVFLAAGRVGGIGANNAYPADFIRDNLSIIQNVIDGAHKADVERLVFFGSSCIYPREAKQPVKEEALLTGALEPTNEAYAIAKIAGLKLCQFYRRQYGRAYISLMPTNLYGPHDRYDAETAHVIPAMIMKFTNAVRNGEDSVTLWGTGAAFREFLHVDDLADAALYLCERYDDEPHINIGSGEEVSIKELAGMIAKESGFKGQILFDSSMPDGMPRKLLDCARLHQLGWGASISLNRGILNEIKAYGQIY